MARPLRIELKGPFYHVTARGNEGGKKIIEEKILKTYQDVSVKISGG